MRVDVERQRLSCLAELSGQVSDENDHSTRERSTNVRQALKRAADAESEAVVGALLEALEARKTATFSCHSCGRRNEVSIDDHRTRVDAAERLVAMGYGRPREASDSSSPETIRRKSLEDLTPDEVDLRLAQILREEHGDERVHALIQELTG